MRPEYGAVRWISRPGSCVKGLSKFPCRCSHLVLSTVLKHLIKKGILEKSVIRLEIFPVFSRTAGNFGHRFRQAQ